MARTRALLGVVPVTPLAEATLWAGAILALTLAAYHTGADAMALAAYAGALR